MGAGDGGIPPKGYIWRPPKPVYRTEDRAQAEGRVRAREQESSSKRAGERRVTGGGRGGEKREGREESHAREGCPPVLAVDRQRARPTKASGPETNTEGHRDPMTSAVLTCVHAGRRVKKNQQTRQGQQTTRQDTKPERRGGQTTEKKTKQQCTAGGRKAPSEQAAEERVGANGAGRNTG